MTDLDRLKSASTLTDLAMLLGFTPSGLAHTLYVAPAAARYKTFDIPKSDGSTRVIEAPLGAQRLAQANLAELLQSCRNEIAGKTKRRALFEPLLERIALAIADHHAKTATATAPAAASPHPSAPPASVSVALSGT